MAVNFDDQPVSIAVNLPAHAFDFLGIPEKQYTATDLLGGGKQTLQLKKDGCLALQLEERGSVVLKMKTGNKR